MLKDLGVSLLDLVEQVTRSSCVERPRSSWPPSSKPDVAGRRSDQPTDVWRSMIRYVDLMTRLRNEHELGE